MCAVPKNIFWHCLFINTARHENQSVSPRFKVLWACTGLRGKRGKFQAFRFQGVLIIIIAVTFCFLFSVHDDELEPCVYSLFDGHLMMSYLFNFRRFQPCHLDTVASSNTAMLCIPGQFSPTQKCWNCCIDKKLIPLSDKCNYSSVSGIYLNKRWI